MAARAAPAKTPDCVALGAGTAETNKQTNKQLIKGHLATQMKYYDSRKNYEEAQTPGQNIGFENKFSASIEKTSTQRIVWCQKINMTTCRHESI